MKQLRPIARVILLHDNKILLVRNRNADFWYPPGGGWEFEYESLKDCARREVKEETNYDVAIDQLIWVSEFREGEKVYLESYWRAHLIGAETNLHLQHTDQDENGAVVEVKWFTEEDIANLVIFPSSLKNFLTFSTLQYDAYVSE